MEWLARGFGSSRFRGLLAAIICLLVGLAAIGLLRLEFDDNHRKFFQGSSDAYEQLEKLAAAFPLDENDFILLFESGYVPVVYPVPARRSFQDGNLLPFVSTSERSLQKTPPPPRAPPWREPTSTVVVTTSWT